MTKSLKKRIDRLEKGSDGDLDAKLRALAQRLGISPDRLFTVAGEHKRRLSQIIGRDGTVTWQEFCFLRELGLFA